MAIFNYSTHCATGKESIDYLSNNSMVVTAILINN